MNITLIANSGIQFHRFQLEVDPNRDVIRSLGFYELEESDSQSVTLQFATFIPSLDIWVPKEILKFHGFLDDNGHLDEEIDYKVLKPFALDEDTGLFTVGDIESILKYFASGPLEAQWFPVPYFKRNLAGKHAFGPLAWARLMLKELPSEDPKSKKKNYAAVLAFDTEVSDGLDPYFSPRPTDSDEPDNSFGFCDNEDLLLHFCDMRHSCEWVNRAIKRILQNGRDAKQPPFLRYLAQYLYLLRYLQASGVFPDVIFYTDNSPSVDVDLILDIGNANTCGILFETPPGNRPFEFTTVKKLAITDLTDPTRVYNDPFSMRITFVEPRFGEIEIPQHKCFKWPSLVRVGEEAETLINRHNMNIGRGKETSTNLSSPKRYLWDIDRSDVQWEFINFKGQDLKDAIYYEGISEQFREDGSYAFDGNFSCTPYYSRKSLMTFVYIEVLLHAITQINSHAFRLAHGNLIRPRKLKRITITCPTSIIQYEQVALRELAMDAVRTLKRFFSNSFLGAVDKRDNKTQTDLLVLPAPEELRKDLTQSKTKKDWIYDEATCGQLVFLYGEITKRYLNKADRFVSLFGKRRSDVADGEQDTITMATVDIGGGTTDLMICAYQVRHINGQTILTPNPLYFESLNLAGDDLLKELVQGIVIEGTPTMPEEEGCMGVIEQEARRAGVENVSMKLQYFFGQDSNNQGYVHRGLRKNFVIQVAIPIIKRYMEHAARKQPDRLVSFQELFLQEKPNQNLIDYFNNLFAPLRFEQIQWKLSAARVSRIIENTFDAAIRYLSTLCAVHGADFLLLAGKPTSLPRIRDLFLRYHPVSPDRLISLNNYRVGRWYPFADDIGYFSDSKTLVCVGAAIALMSDKLDKMDGSKLNSEKLREKLVATSDYIGVLDRYTQLIQTPLFSPDQNQAEIEVHGLPIILGYKQLPNPSLRARPIYKIQISDAEIRKKLLNQHPDMKEPAAIAKAIEAERTKIKNKLPLKILLKRNFQESKEAIQVERIRDDQGEELSRSALNCGYMTLKEEYGYWLDTGEFSLNIG